MGPSLLRVVITDHKYVGATVTSLPSCADSAVSLTGERMNVYICSSCTLETQSASRGAGVGTPHTTHGKGPGRFCQPVWRGTRWGFQWKCSSTEWPTNLEQICRSCKILAFRWAERPPNQAEPLHCRMLGIVDLKKRVRMSLLAPNDLNLLKN